MKSVHECSQFLFELQWLKTNTDFLSVYYCLTCNSNTLRTRVHTCTSYERAFMGMSAPNPHIHHYLVWQYRFHLRLFLFAPTFTGTPLRSKKRAAYYLNTCTVHLLLFFFITNKCATNPTTCTFSTHPTQQPVHSLHILPNSLHILYTSNPIKVYITTVHCVIYIITQRDFCDIYFYYIICALLLIITNLKNKR